MRPHSAALERALSLARTALAFARVDRATRHEDGVRPESDTDHTVMLGFVACELAPPGLDRAKIAAFALVHDIVEVYAGDTPTLVVTPEIVAAKAAREDAARARLAMELGSGSWIAATLATYEQQQEPEARFVRLVDKVLPKLTHAFNACAAAKHMVDREGFAAAHAKQLKKLRGEYPEFPDTLALLDASMLHAEACWSGALDGSAPPGACICAEDDAAPDAAPPADDRPWCSCGSGTWYGCRVHDDAARDGAR